MTCAPAKCDTGDCVEPRVGIFTAIGAAIFGRPLLGDPFPMPCSYVLKSPPLAPAAPRTIIAFTGLAGSGKSTAAAHLVNRYGYTRVRFAGPLKAMLAALGCTPDEIDGHLKEQPCDLLGGKTPRFAMQQLGTEWGRDTITPDLWIRAWQAALARTAGNVVVDDCRFPNEAEAVQAAGGVIIQIERPGAGAGAAGHSSEGQQLPAAVTIHNTGSENDLLFAVDELVSDLSWSERLQPAT